MLKITSDQWNRYSLKYSKLIWTIAHRISGDSMTASLEDNFSDLSIAALESINGFHKKTGKSFDEMIEMKLFDQYTKTCLWTAKARKGVKLTERMPFRKRHISFNNYLDSSENSEFSEFDIEDTSATARYSRVDADDMYESYDKKIQRLICLLESNPEMMTESGDLKIQPIAKKMNMTPKKVAQLIKIMENKNDCNR